MGFLVTLNSTFDSSCEVDFGVGGCWYTIGVSASLGFGYVILITDIDGFDEDNEDEVSDDTKDAFVEGGVKRDALLSEFS